MKTFQNIVDKDIRKYQRSISIIIILLLLASCLYYCGWQLDNSKVDEVEDTRIIKVY